MLFQQLITLAPTDLNDFVHIVWRYKNARHGVSTDAQPAAISCVRARYRSSPDREPRYGVEPRWLNTAFSPPLDSGEFATYVAWTTHAVWHAWHDKRLQGSARIHQEPNAHLGVNLGQ